MLNVSSWPHKGIKGSHGNGLAALLLFGERPGHGGFQFFAARNALPMILPSGPTSTAKGMDSTPYFVESSLLGIGLPDDNANSPNEKFNLDRFEKGRRMSAHLWSEQGR